MEGDAYYYYDDDYPPYCLKRSDSVGSVTESSISSESELGSTYFTYEDHCGPGLKNFLVKRLKSRISALGISSFLFEKITNDILRMSESEPYGIRGATVVFKILDSKGKENKFYKLQPVTIDEGCVSTFRLVFHLVEESMMISNIGRVLRGLFFKGWKSNNKHPLRICQDYKLYKKQLFRSSDYYY
ncbi:unnamed protein product [Lepeophtheirus salmonis]|nr:unnamed protein product [Lepeophtheirus salmonis]CAF2934466.1 unnamed protein product [Lepeophtheirus salmonis]